MSIRQNILSNIKTQIISLSAKKYYKGYIPINAVTEYPTIFYGIGKETLKDTNESNSFNTYEADAYIGVHFTTNTDVNKTGLLTDAYEQWISDLKQFIMSTLKLSDCLSWNINNVDGYNDYNENKGVVFITFKCLYQE